MGRGRHNPGSEYLRWYPAFGWLRRDSFKPKVLINGEEIEPEEDEEDENGIPATERGRASARPLDV